MTLLLALAALWGASPAGPIPDGSRQLVTVTTAGWTATDGTLRRYARADAADAWRPVGAPVSVVVGRSGLGWGRGLHGVMGAGPIKAEGDGRAPAGAFRLTAAFGYAASEPTGLPYVQSRRGVQCVDDRRSAFYNLVLDSTAVGDRADWGSKERMRRRDRLYRIGAIVAHNGRGVADAGPGPSAPRPVAGAGSCIFLHVWRGPGSTTAGCTAMPDAALQRVLAWLDAEADPVLVQLPQSEADRLRDPWGLPASP